MAGRRSGGIGLGGILVILGIVLAIVWSFWWGLIIGLVGLVFFDVLEARLRSLSLCPRPLTSCAIVSKSSKPGEMIRCGLAIVKATPSPIPFATPPRG